MRPFVKWYARACNFSALFAITVQSFTIKNLTALQLPKWLAYAIPFLAATTTYMLLYNLLIWFYERKGWKLLLKEYNISGKWYHEYRSPADASYIRRGITNISQGVWHISFNGKNYDVDLNPLSRTMWKSTAVTLEDDGRLVIAYEARRSDQRNPVDTSVQKEGILTVTIDRDEKNYAVTMTGIFQDAWPSKRRGTITWWKNTDWSQEIDRQ
ncbi:hypothetical protein [Candidatus Electronema sp. JC]|uniref:hypothetical protein n=1 Tax=Candidatus Electronema sp. JC TaxID=3401570 RepID=UPI003AA90E84